MASWTHFKKKSSIMFLIITSIIAVTLCVAFYYMGMLVFNGCTQLSTNKETAIIRYDQEMYANLEAYGISVDEFRKAYAVEIISISSSLDGHAIPADYLSVSGNKNNDTVILVHGLGRNRIYVYPYAEMFLKMGYNVISYDQRSSGDNTAEYNTFGYFESYDLLDYVNYADSLIDDDKQLVVWGTSFGGATVGIAVGRNSDKIDRLILDCPLSDPSYMVKKEIAIESTQKGIPSAFIMFAGNIFLRMQLGFSLDDVDVCKWIQDTPVPVLIFNSRADTTTPYFMGEDIYKAIRSKNKKLISVDDSEHVAVLQDYPELYKKEVFNFLKKTKFP